MSRPRMLPCPANLLLRTCLTFPGSDRPAEDDLLSVGLLARPRELALLLVRLDPRRPPVVEDTNGLGLDLATHRGRLARTEARARPKRTRSSRSARPRPSASAFRPCTRGSACGRCSGGTPTLRGLSSVGQAPRSPRPGRRRCPQPTLP